jgi:uncharacterized membrane protein YhhN
LIAACSAICVAACLVLIAAEYLQLRGVRIASKLIASAAFVALGIHAFRLSPGTDPATVQLGHAIITGLVLGAIGDACLLGHGRATFLAGLIAFLLGHLCYIAGIAMIEPPERWLADAGVWAALPVLTGVVVLRQLWPRLGSMRIPVIGYVIAICVMVIAAIAAARGATIPSDNRIRLALGACLFFVSDLSVARDRFVEQSFQNKLYGLPAYYGGQLFIAWTLLGL